MEIEVEIRVLTKGTSSDTLRTLRQSWVWGDNSKHRLAGEAYAVEKTADLLSESIRNELKGADDYNLNDTVGTPHQA